VEDGYHALHPITDSSYSSNHTIHNINSVNTPVQHARHRHVACSLLNMRHKCPSCGCQDYWNFRVPDDIWSAVVPRKFQRRVICLQCFDKFAVARAIRYAHSLKELYFAGEMAVFKFAVETASNGSAGEA
jgi:hypothetical protein